MVRPLLCGETHATVTDLHRVLEAVVELHLHAPVLGDGVQDHPKEQLPQALENSVLAGASGFRAHGNRVVF